MQRTGRAFFVFVFVVAAAASAAVLRVTLFVLLSLPFVSLFLPFVLLLLFCCCITTLLPATSPLPAALFATSQTQTQLTKQKRVAAPQRPTLSFFALTLT